MNVILPKNCQLICRKHLRIFSTFFREKGKGNDLDEEKRNGLFSRKTMVPFGISMSLMIFQQWTGVNTVIFNTVTIFSAAKISINEYVASNIVGVVQLLATGSKLISRKKIILNYDFLGVGLPIRNAHTS